MSDPGAGTRQSRGRGRSSWWRLNYVGLVLGLVAIALALGPSLLPRPWVFQGIVAGIAGAIGYGLGVLVSWAFRRPSRVEPGPGGKRIAWWGLLVLGAVLFVAAIVAGGAAQNEVRLLVGEQPLPSLHVGGIAVVTLGVALLLVLAGRGVRRLTRWISRPLRRLLPPRVAGVTAAVLVALLGYLLAAGILFQWFVAAMDGIYAAQNAGTPPGASQPALATRSGSPDSLAAWSTLGLQGRGFVGRGPGAQQIQAFRGSPAQEPIRVYVGLDTAESPAARAALALAELERTGAFDRAVLVVAGATGTGWLEPQSVTSLEYLWGGDTAIATIQYSYLPSWLSFLVDQDRATQAGRELFEAVYDRWATLPEDGRPKLLVYGLSLGSFAAQAPFSGVQDLQARTDGALFMGTPNFTEPWRSITDRRDSGTPEWQPVYQQGRTARFAAAAGDLARPGTDWTGVRVVFMQHASDPVIWWSPDLLSRRPDWLAEPRGPDVSPATRWLPILTFLQVTVDQFFGVNVPVGHGHNYSNTIVYAWTNVLPPPGWEQPDLDRLQELINTMPIE